MTPALRNAIQLRLWVHRALERSLDPSEFIRRADRASATLTAEEYSEYYGVVMKEIQEHSLTSHCGVL